MLQKFFTSQVPFLSPNKQHQSTEGVEYLTDKQLLQNVMFGA